MTTSIIGKTASDLPNMSGCVCLSGQEEAFVNGDGIQSPRERTQRMVQRFYENRIPHLDIQRAMIFTESCEHHEELPIVLRTAKAQAHVFKNIKVEIFDDELLVGTGGGAGRYAILFPELRAAWYTEGLKKTQELGCFTIQDDEIQQMLDKVVPFWKGKTYTERYEALMPDDLRTFTKGDGKGSPVYMQDYVGDNSTINYVANYKRVLYEGMQSIVDECEERIKAIRADLANNHFEQLIFLEAVKTTCSGMIIFANRYADKAEEMAKTETNPTRKAELEQIAVNCRQVPAKPAQNFWQAMQSLWFVQLGYSLEQQVSGNPALGRFDQYMYPFYKKDIEAGIIDDERVLELMDCLWTKLAAVVQFNTSNASNVWEGYAHFENVTIGGVDRTGRDVTNELSYLILRSKKEYPLQYPEVSMRMHSGTPDKFLHEAAELVKMGSGLPKFFNDEEIIPFLMNIGFKLQDAREYASGGCTEVRVPYLDTYLVQNCQFALTSPMDMALHDGYLTFAGRRGRIIEPKVKSEDIQTFDDVLNNFRECLDLYVRNFYTRQSILELMDGEMSAAPFMSAMHPACLAAAEDIHKPQAGKAFGAIYQDTGNCTFVGFGTVVESMCALKKLVFDDKVVSFKEYMQAVDANYEGYEPLRQMILNAPKYGNNDAYADEVAYQIDSILNETLHQYRTPYGEKFYKFVPVTAHNGLGSVIGATPNGRKAGVALSEGISPSQGYDSQGALATITSIAHARSRINNNDEARLLNIKLSPQTIAGETGTRNLMQLLRAWCDLKLWHIQFNVVNRETLEKAQQDPDHYRNLLVRVAGYSAFFTDLSNGMQNEIINRTEHETI